MEGETTSAVLDADAPPDEPARTKRNERAGLRPGSSSLVVLANRLPVNRVKRGDRYELEVSPGGLVSALMPILRAKKQPNGKGGGSPGAWIGWGGHRDKLGLDAFEHDGIINRPVHIGAEEFEGYYEGISNASLWPLYHDAIRTPRYRRPWWPRYEAVNRRFAEAAAEAAARGGCVWVHDYHLHLVPRMLREMRPDLRIGFFLHIPFPGPGLFAQLPWRKQIVEGTLGADLVGFQTKQGAANFRTVAARYAGAHRTSGGVQFDDRTVRIDAFPISIDTRKIEETAAKPEVQRQAAEYRKRLGGRKVILGVDRLDYTKGIDTRLRAFAELLGQKALTVDEAVFVQSAVPTRERSAEYAALRSEVEELVGRINGDYSTVGVSPVHYMRQTLALDDLVALYASADVMVVTPYRDGMNLVAKEYVASKIDGSGVLVLSEFTGAANELKQAVLVNPHDIDGLSIGLDQAVHMEPREARRRMRSMRETVRRHTVYDWASGFLEALLA